jgi:hypothetical protein
VVTYILNSTVFLLNTRSFLHIPLSIRSLDITSSVASLLEVSNFAGNQIKGGDVGYPSLGDTVAAILQGTDELYFATTENLLGSVAIL